MTYRELHVLQSLFKAVVYRLGGIDNALEFAGMPSNGAKELSNGKVSKNTEAKILAAYKRI